MIRYKRVRKYIFPWQKTRCDKAEMYRAEFNFAREDADIKLAQLMFQCDKGESIYFFPMNWTWEDIMVAIQRFDSKGEARKAGFTGPLPAGLHKKVLRKSGFFADGFQGGRIIWTFVPMVVP